MVNPFRLRGRHSRHHSYQLHEKPPVERHFVSVISSVLSIILLVLALSMKVWAKGSNPSCTIVFGLTSVAVTRHHAPNSSVTNFGMSDYYTESQQILISCVISVAVLTILSSIVASAISMGYPREKMEFLRHFSVFNVVSLLCTVLVSGLWLALVERLPQGSPDLRTVCDFASMPVVFGYCYYIVLVAALFSLGAATYNLFCSRKAADRRRRLRNRLRQQQRRLGFDPQFLANQRELIGIVPPNYVAIENPLNQLEEQETSMEQSEQDDGPLTPPPPYTH